MPRKFYRTLWTFTVPGYAFYSVTGKWCGYMTPEERDEERSRRSPKHGSWSSNWLNVKTKRAVMKMCERSLTGYAVYRKYKRVRGEWRMAECNIRRRG